MASFIYKCLLKNTFTMTRSVGSIVRFAPFRNQIIVSRCMFSSELSSSKDQNVPEISNIENQTLSLDEKALALQKQKNLSPFVIYVKDHYKEYANQNPTLKSTQLMVMLSKKWKSMSFDEKLEYFKKAEKNRSEKAEELEKLFKSFSLDEQIACQKRLTQNRAVKNETKKLLRIKKEQRDNNKPKRPTNAFGIYMKSLDRGDASFLDFNKGAVLKWKALPTQEREFFEKESQALREQFENDIKTWETEMIFKGKENLCRKTTVKMLQQNLNKEISEKLSDDLKKQKFLEKDKLFAEMVKKNDESQTQDLKQQV